MTKQDLRIEIQSKRLELELSQYLSLCKKVTDQVITEYFDDVKSIHVFIGMQKKREINTLPVIVEALRRGIEVWAPVILANKTLVHGKIKSLSDLNEGPFGLIQPEEDSNLVETELVLVPGLAFTLDGNRIGWGKGYYDGFLSNLRSDTILAGLCFDFQLLPVVPVDIWDVKMNRIITESGSYICQSSI